MRAKFNFCEPSFFSFLFFSPVILSTLFLCLVFVSQATFIIWAHGNAAGGLFPTNFAQLPLVVPKQSLWPAANRVGDADRAVVSLPVPKQPLWHLAKRVGGHDISDYSVIQSFCSCSFILLKCNTSFFSEKWTKITSQAPSPQLGLA